MEIVVRRAEVALACIRQGLTSKLAPVVPSAQDNSSWPHSKTAHRIFESESMEDSRRVGADLDSRADLAQFGGLLEDLNLEASAAHRQCRREAADPCADDYDSHLCDLICVAKRVRIIFSMSIGLRSANNMIMSMVRYNELERKN